MKIMKTLLPAFTLAALSLAGPVTTGEMKHDHADHGEAKMEMAEHAVGDLMLKAAFARATLPNQPVAGAFLSITNVGSEDDVLIGFSSPIAGRGEVHEMKMDGDTMRMRELADGLVIPAGETVELKPGGYHLMFMEIAEPLVEGEMVEGTLEFQNAGSVAIQFAIMGKGAKSMDHSGHGS